MLFIVNPIAGGGRATETVAIISKYCQQHNIEAIMRYTEYAGHAVELARDNAGEDKVIAVGGDGTVREVAMGLIGTGAALGIVACGTGNDLCVSLGIPKDTQSALDIIARGETKLIDTISVDGQVVINAVGIGFDASVVKHTQRFKKTFKGIGAYLMGILFAILGARKFPIHVQSQEAVFDSKTLLTEVANGSTIGGGMKVAPDASIDDGYMDVCSAGDLPLIIIPVLLPKFVKGDHIKLTKYVRYFKTKKVDIQTKVPVLSQIDGELVMLNKLNFELHEKSLKVIV